MVGELLDGRKSAIGYRMFIIETLAISNDLSSTKLYSIALYHIEIRLPVVTQANMMSTVSRVCMLCML